MFVFSKLMRCFVQNLPIWLPRMRETTIRTLWVALLLIIIIIPCF